MLKNIPKELQELDQWVLGTKSKIKKNDKVPIDAKNGGMGDPVKSETWADFETACNARSNGRPHIGFVLSQDDPYSIIDLDDPYDPDKAWDDETRAKHAKLNSKILKSFPSYTEISQSGKGVHIIVKGSIPKGVNRDTVELYSSQRYLITTGNILKDLPIVDCQAMLTILFEEMSPKDNREELVDIEQTDDDAIVVDRATAAANGERFLELYNSVPDGDRNSEQDMALLSIICFYTKSNEQARRIFRTSGRGERVKVNKNDKYLNFTLQVIRSNEVPDIDFSAMKARLVAVHSTAVKEKVATDPEVQKVDFSKLIAKSRAVAQGKPISNIKAVNTQSDSSVSFQFPEGLIGKLADYFYSSAARPVKEIGLMASLGFFAGLVGRQFNVSSVGLNQYLILLAGTGTGKEGVAEGMSRIINVLRKEIPMVADVLGPSAFASGPALIKTMSDRQCFVSVLGEFGLTLQELNDPKASSANSTLKRALLDLYMKSGHESILQASVYSDKDKNTDIVQSPALTILGESTPEAFYEGLSEHSIAEGLVPRFTVYEYVGPVPYLNENLGKRPTKELVNLMIELVQAVMDMKMNQTFCQVRMTPEVIKEARKFEHETTDLVNRSNSEVLNKLWSRADLKIKKLAALLAVGINFKEPIITMTEYKWSRKFIENDIKSIVKRFSRGDVGYGEDKQRSDVHRLIRSYFSKKKVAKQYEHYKEQGVVPISLLRRGVPQLNSFKKDNRGISFALRAVLQDCIEAGELVEVPASQAKSMFHTTSKLYAIGDSWRNE